jgi:hypothetical protein
MAFLVEDGTGLATSNSYLSVADFKTFHTDRGTDISAFGDDEIQQGLVMATDFIDRRYLYVGTRSNTRDQALEWPRVNGFDPDGNLIDSSSVPIEVEHACAELGFTALSQSLMPNLDFDSSGGFLTESTSSVGSVRQTVKYSTLQGRKNFPTYTSPDALLRRVARFNRQLVRAS